jgi:2-dehydro-3-deoxyphosphogluconate aldolase/(4S)-4-hydroxy-2-oxoglutarate aldolase
VISHLVKYLPEVIVGAGGISDVETARRCLDAGAQFLASDGLDAEIVNFALKQSVVVIPGTLTPSEVLSAWKMGPDFVKVVPCAPAMGGESYIRALKAMFPNVPLIAAGGVNQQTASSFILAGAVALGIGTELIPRESIRMRQGDRIGELARRFVGFVSSARSWSFGG